MCKKSKLNGMLTLCSKSTSPAYHVYFVYLFYHFIAKESKANNFVCGKTPQEFYLLVPFLYILSNFPQWKPTAVDEPYFSKHFFPKSKQVLLKKIMENFTIWQNVWSFLKRGKLCSGSEEVVIKTDFSILKQKGSDSFKGK